MILLICNEKALLLMWIQCSSMWWYYGDLVGIPLITCKYTTPKCSSMGTDHCWASGGKFAILPPFCPIFNIGGMNLDHDFVQVSKFREYQKKVITKNETLSPNSGEDQKKVFTKNGTLFFPEFKYTPTLRCTPESNYWGGCRCRPYSNYWGDTVKLLGAIYPPPPGCRHPCVQA